MTGQPSTTTPRRRPRPSPAIMPLGDSITYGDQGKPAAPSPAATARSSTPTCTNAGYTFNFVGSQTGNASATLTAAGQVNNEGHNGYRIDQITNNLDASDGTGGNNGGYWLAGGGGTGRAAPDPDDILLHIGTNDILQHYDPSFSGTAPEATFLGRPGVAGSTPWSPAWSPTARPPTCSSPASSRIPNHTNVNGVTRTPRSRPTTPTSRTRWSRSSSAGRPRLLRRPVRTISSTPTAASRPR